MKSFPWTMLQSDGSGVSKALHKGDIDVIVAFLFRPTGQKLLKEMPEMMAESMQAMMPLLQKQMTSMQERVQQEVAAIMKESDLARSQQRKPARISCGLEDPTPQFPRSYARRR